MLNVKYITQFKTNYKLTLKNELNICYQYLENKVLLLFYAILELNLVMSKEKK